MLSLSLSLSLSHDSKLDSRGVSDSIYSIYPSYSSLVCLY